MPDTSVERAREAWERWERGGKLPLTGYQLADRFIAALERENAELRERLGLDRPNPFPEGFDAIDLLNQRLAAERTARETAEAALVRVQQCHAYRMPVRARDLGTGEVGVHWIEGFDRAEVGAVIRDDSGDWESFQSVAWRGDPEAALAKAEAERDRLSEALQSIKEEDGPSNPNLVKYIDGVFAANSPDPANADGKEDS